MTFTDVHIAVRDTLRGSPFSAFLVTVQSAEQHPGRVEIEWRVFVSDGPDLFFKGPDPMALVEMLRVRLADLLRASAPTDPPLPLSLEAIGDVPPHGDAL